MCRLVVKSYDDSMFESVYEVEESSFERPYTRSYLRFILTLAGEYALVAVLCDSIVGYIAAVPLLRWRTAHIVSIAVKPGYRGRYIGSALLHSLEELLVEDGYHIAFLETWVSNTNAIRFYEAHGYRPLAVIPRYYEWGEAAILYYKLLTKSYANANANSVGGIAWQR